MEHEMKLSPAAVRQARIARGWSQEQLALASGLSLRTVQRVESEGVASLGTAASLAATFSIPLLQLQALPAPPARRAPSTAVYGAFYLGLVILTLAGIGESGRLPSDPQSAGYAAIDLLAGLVGLALCAASGIRVMRGRQYAGVALAVLGTPLVTLLLGGLTVAALTQRLPLWQLLGIGAAGTALVAMSIREFRRGAQPGPNNSSKPTPLRGAA